MDLTHSPFPIPALFGVIQTLKGVLGDVARRGLLAQAVAFLVAGRLMEMVAKIDRMLAALRAGTLVVRGPRVAAVRVASDVVEVSARRVPAVMWPRRSMWLVRLAGYPAAGMGSQFAALLQTPELVALLLASPQAARVLRPMCRMLGVATSLLDPRLPEPVFVAPVAKVSVKRVRAQRPPIDWGRVPLPRGVLTYARRLGIKPVR